MSGDSQNVKIILFSRLVNIFKLSCMGFQAVDHFFIIHSSQCLLSYLAVLTLSNAMVQIVEFALDSEPTNDIDLISSLFYIILAPQTHYSKIKIPFYKYLKKKSFMQNSSGIINP